MIISSSCPERFWGEAALTAVFTINRLPSSFLGNMSPYERLYKEAPDYTSLKVFGSACFVLLQPHEYTKLEPRARVCFFLGYGIEHKGYRCWDPISNRIRISRHVIFWEHIKFSSLSKFESIPSSPVSFFSNPSVELFQSDIDTGSSGESDIALNGSTIPSDEGPSDGPVHANSTTSSSPVESSIDSSTLETNIDPEVPSSSIHPEREKNRPSYLRDYQCYCTMLN